MSSALRQGDVTAAARIRDAAIACIAEGGSKGATARAVAERAGVSPALVLHHFGSMRALRDACDAHVATLIRTGKSDAMRAGAGLDVVAALRAQAEGPPLVAYLARSLHDGSERLNALIDELVSDAEGYLREGVAAGLLRPLERPRDVAALLLLWSLGALALHEQVGRYFGVDLLDQRSVATDGQRYMAAALAVYGEGIMTPDAAARVRGSLLAAPDKAASPQGGEDAG